MSKPIRKMSSILMGILLGTLLIVLGFHTFYTGRIPFKYADETLVLDSSGSLFVAIITGLSGLWILYIALKSLKNPR